MLEKEMKIPVASIDTTSGLVSALQLVDTTPAEMFAIVRNDTSELELQRIIYSPIELQHNIIYSPVELPKKEKQEV